MANLFDQHHLSNQEIDNLRSLLLSEDENNVLVGLQMLETQPDLLSAVGRIVLLWLIVPYSTEAIKKQAKKILLDYLGSGAFDKQFQSLQIFDISRWDWQGWNVRQDFMKRYLAQHEHYAPYLYQHSMLIEQINNTVHKLLNDYAWASTSQLNPQSLNNDVSQTLSQFIKTLITPLYEQGSQDMSNTVFWNACLIFAHLLPPQLSAKALDLLAQQPEQQPQFWSVWIFKALGRIYLFQLHKIPKALGYFEQAFGQDDFEKLDLYIADLAMHLPAQQGYQDAQDLVGQLIQHFVQKHPKALHTRLWLANQYWYQDAPKQALTYYHQVLDHLPNNRVLAGGKGSFAALQINPKFNSPADIETYLRYIEILFILQHREQLQKSEKVLAELLEWDISETYRPDIETALTHIRELLS